MGYLWFLPSIRTALSCANLCSCFFSAVIMHRPLHVRKKPYASQFALGTDFLASHGQSDLDCRFKVCPDKRASQAVRRMLEGTSRSTGSSGAANFRS